MKLPRLPNPAKRFTAKQLEALRKGFAGIKSVDPANPTYTKLMFMLDSYSQTMLKQLAEADIKFLSKLARNRIKRKGTPNMKRKKKRTAKQLANDRRLGRMAKARAKKKRGKNPRKKKTVIDCGACTVAIGAHTYRKGCKKFKTKKKVTKKKTRRANPKRTALKKSHLWTVFKCISATYGTGKSIKYLGVGKTGSMKFGARSARFLFQTKQAALNAAKKYPGTVGVTSDRTTGAKIMSYCTGKA